MDLKRFLKIFSGVTKGSSRNPVRPPPLGGGSGGESAPIYELVVQENFSVFFL